MLLLFPFLVHPVSCYFWEFTSTSKHQVDYGVDVREELDSNKTLRKKGLFQRIHCQTLQYLRSSESFYSRLIEKVKINNMEDIFCNKFTSRMSCT